MCGGRGGDLHLRHETVFPTKLISFPRKENINLPVIVPFFKIYMTRYLYVQEAISKNYLDLLLINQFMSHRIHCSAALQDGRIFEASSILQFFFFSSQMVALLSKISSSLLFFLNLIFGAFFSTSYSNFSFIFSKRFYRQIIWLPEVKNAKYHSVFGVLWHSLNIIYLFI